MKIFTYSVIAVVLVVVIAGFWLIGSPLQERMRKFDERRLNDLQSLQSRIVEYWRTKGELPKDLVSLNDDISGFRIPKDPMSGQYYEYSVAAPETFSFCANFNLSSDQKMQQPSYPNVSKCSYGVKCVSMNEGQDVWAHGSGRVCFDRTIDKDIYKPYPQVSYPTGM